MSDPESIDLTVSEIGYLWSGYTINEMSRWYLMIFQQRVSDLDIKYLYSDALEITNELIRRREHYLSKGDFPIPLGFSESDINKQAPALFSDRFILQYLYVGAQLGLSFHARALATSTRSDVGDYMAECLIEAAQLSRRIIDLLLRKGLYWRGPTIPSPKTQEVMHEQSYLNGWLGNTRPLNSIEIANLYSTMELLALIEALCVGFAQTAEIDDVKEILLQGSSVAEDQYSQLAQLLNNDSLPIPPTYIGEVTDCKERIFSDRLMVSHIGGLFGSLITLSGSSLGCVMEHDLIMIYTELHVKTGGYAEKITKFMINQEWLEKIPGAIEREELIHT